MLAGRGDTPQHVRTNTYPVMNNVENDFPVTGAIVLGITGKTSSAGGNSWNASQECCWPPADGAGPDDDGWIDTVITRVIAAGWPVDLNRIYVWGHSAGSAMAFRYACDHPSRVAGIFAMSTFGIRVDQGDPACAAGHYNAIHFHGTADTVLYDNNSAAVLAPNTVEYVSVEVDRTNRPATATQHASQNGCTGTLQTTTLNWLDFDASVPGNETDLLTWSSCPTDGQVQVWRANGTAHVPSMTVAGKNQMLLSLSQFTK